MIELTVYKGLSDQQWSSVHQRSYTSFVETPQDSNKTVKYKINMQFQISFALIAMIVCFVAAAEEAKSASTKSVNSKSATDRSKRGLYAPLVTSPYAPAYAAPYAAPYTAPYAATYAAPYAAPYVAPYAAPYAAPYVASPYAVAPYTSSYVSSYGAYPYGYASPYGFY
ncbi:vitelline membrane protein Vm26Ab-like [Aphis gossypii]|uniref:Uncharacterized protein n=1 Tax=Aphis gossypii TaxID=80765 RepID=A0A9P0NAY9_APHGO|nr:vitelline membrane protein Vm26Ab-like [Aphis gossypii]CAH1708910.1 unnamed protein product [Aphis gossypii]